MTIEFESKALTWKFWDIVLKFYDLPNKFQGTIAQIVFKINSASPENAKNAIRLSDGFFYSTVLPILLKNNVLIDTGKFESRFGRGRMGKIYLVNLDNLDKFLIHYNSMFKRIYKKWVKEGDVELDLI